MIIQITTSATESGHEIFGLGDDNLVHTWNYHRGEWQPYNDEYASAQRKKVQEMLKKEAQS